MPPKRRVLPLLLALVLLISASIPARAQNPEPLYFSETGHWVTGPFLTFYQSVSDPLLLYGYPITDSYKDELTGLTVQFFQHARFEQHPEAAPAQRIQLSALGSLLYEPGQPANISNATPDCLYFSSGKYSLCSAFLDFYQTHGGTAQFGEPISDIEVQQNLYVQYFERARFEWHPERSTGDRVMLGDLGREYFDKTVGNVDLLVPKIGKDLPGALLQLQARAFLDRAVVSPGAKQVLSVVVHDQYLRPVPQASVDVKIHFPVGMEEHYSLPKTDADGITRLEFEVGKQPSNSVVILDVDVTQGELATNAGTWFRVWW